MKAIFLFSLFLAGLCICLARYKKSDFSDEERMEATVQAVADAKLHMQAREEALAHVKSKGDGAARLLSKFFRRASAQSSKVGKARFFMEDAVRRAEQILFDKKRSQLASAMSKEKQAELLAEELFHTPGSLLSSKEIGYIYEESECSDAREPVDCTEVDNVNIFRTADGTCNNLADPLQGASGTRFARLLPPAYEDGIYQLRGIAQSKSDGIFINGPFTPPNPSARLVSINIVGDRTDDQADLTHLVMQWGQFIDHDLDLAVEIEGADCDLENCVCTDICAPVRVPEDDQQFGVGTTRDGNCLPFVRTVPACSLADPGQFEPRQHVNELTSYIDGSMVYGSTLELANFLREMQGGLLKVGPRFPLLENEIEERSSSMSESATASTSGGDSLPFAPPCPGGSTAEECCPPGFDRCFIAGDVRVLEQASLTVMHTIWVREHNRIARRLARLNPAWEDERLYQESRKIVGAMIQKITVYDFLPVIFGQELFDALIGEYQGYQPAVDASVPNGFATAAFRFGHSLIQPQFNRLNSRFQSIPEGPLSLVDAFFNPDAYFDSDGTDPILRGLFTQPSRRVDEFLNTVLTSQLFENDDQPGMDLATLNIQRGRDHGLPPYPIWKNFCKNVFNLNSDFKNELTRIRFLQTYGSLDTTDLWVGGLAEEPLPGSIVGATFACIFAITFNNLRAGDRFWFENPSVFTPDQLEEIRGASIARVICDNADDITRIQPNAFRLDQDRRRCRSLPNVNLRAWRDPSADTATIKLEHELLKDKQSAYDSHVQEMYEEETNDIAQALNNFLDSEADKAHMDSENSHAQLIQLLEDVVDELKEADNEN